MSTIDITQVAGLQAVNAEGNVIGTLSVDDLTELVATKIVQEAKNEAVSARSASVMSEASTLAATDEYEDKLDIDTNPAYVRSLDSEGNPKRTATTSLATVVGGLLWENTNFINAIGGIRKLHYPIYNDVNDIKETCFGQFAGTTNNLPANIGGHVLTVYESDERRMQIYATDVAVYIRTCFDSKWYNWMKLFG